MLGKNCCCDEIVFYIGNKRCSIVLYCIVLCCVAWHGMTWHGMAWHGMAWHDMAWHGMAWHGMAWHGMAWHGMAWHGIALHCIVLNIVSNGDRYESCVDDGRIQIVYHIYYLLEIIHCHLKMLDSASSHLRAHIKQGNLFIGMMACMLDALEIIKQQPQECSS